MEDRGIVIMADGILASKISLDLARMAVDSIMEEAIPTTEFELRMRKIEVAERIWLREKPKTHPHGWYRKFEKKRR